MNEDIYTVVIVDHPKCKLIENFNTYQDAKNYYDKIECFMIMKVLLKNNQKLEEKWRPSGGYYR